MEENKKEDYSVTWSRYMQNAHDSAKEREKNPVIWRIKYWFRALFKWR